MLKHEAPESLLRYLEQERAREQEWTADAARVRRIWAAADRIRAREKWTRRAGVAVVVIAVIVLLWL
jgi:hypothetical protein